MYLGAFNHVEAHQDDHTTLAAAPVVTQIPSVIEQSKPVLHKASGGLRRLGKNLTHALKPRVVTVEVPVETVVEKVVEVPVSDAQNQTDSVFFDDQTIEALLESEEHAGEDQARSDIEARS